MNLSYSRRHPTRIVVHGFDVWALDAGYAVLGLAITTIIGATYFKLL